PVLSAFQIAGQPAQKCRRILSVAGHAHSDLLRQSLALDHAAAQGVITGDTIPIRVIQYLDRRQILLLIREGTRTDVDIKLMLPAAKAPSYRPMRLSERLEPELVTGHLPVGAIAELPDQVAQVLVRCRRIVNGFHEST